MSVYPSQNGAMTGFSLGGGVRVPEHLDMAPGHDAHTHPKGKIRGRSCLVEVAKLFRPCLFQSAKNSKFAVLGSWFDCCWGSMSEAGLISI